MFLQFHKNDLAAIILEHLPDNKRNYYTYYLLGRIYFVSNKLPYAVESYTKSIDLNPEFKETYYSRGLAYGFLSPIFYNNAEDDFKKYIEIDNADFQKTGSHAYGAWAGYNDLAWIYYMEGNYELSEQTSRDGLQVAGNVPWLLNTLGSSLLHQGKCEEALPYLKDALNFAEKITIKQFGEAYSGDLPNVWEAGRLQMQNIIKENIKKCYPQK